MREFTSSIMLLFYLTAFFGASFAAGAFLLRRCGKKFNLELSRKRALLLSGTGILGHLIPHTFGVIGVLLLLLLLTKWCKIRFRPALILTAAVWAVQYALFWIVYFLLFIVAEQRENLFMAALLSDPGVSPTVLLLSLFAIRLLFGFACLHESTRKCENPLSARSGISHRPDFCRIPSHDPDVPRPSDRPHTRNHVSCPPLSATGTIRAVKPGQARE